MTDDEVNKEARRHGWDHTVNTGHTLNGYTIYKCLDKGIPGVVRFTGMPTYVLVKDNEIRGPKNGDEYGEIMCIVNGVTKRVYVDDNDEAADG